MTTDFIQIIFATENTEHTEVKTQLLSPLRGFGAWAHPFRGLTPPGYYTVTPSGFAELFPIA